MRYQTKRFAPYLLGIGASVVAVIGRWLIDPWLGDNLPLVTLFGAVAVADWYGGYRPALLAMALGYLACAWLFIEPRESLGFYNIGQFIGLLAYLISCGIIIAFGEGMRSAQNRALDRAELLSVTFSSIGDAVITTDLQARVVSMNRVAESLTGWGEAEASGQAIESVFRIVNEETGQTAENPAEHALREGRVVGLANHTALIAKDGTHRVIDDSAAPIRDKQGNVAGVILVFRDVTERRQAEKELLRSEQELADFFDNATVGLHWVGPDGKLVRANRAELEMLGYSKEEYLGHYIAEFHADDDVIEDILNKLQAGETICSREARLRCKDGSIKHVIIDSNVMWENGRFQHTRCFTRDVTDRKRAEIALAASKEAAQQSLDELETIYNNMPIGTCLIDRELRYTRVNDRLAEMNGIPAAQHVGRTVREIVPELADDVEPAFRRILETGEPVLDVELSGETKAQPGVKRTWLASWYPQWDSSGQIVGINVTAQEITDRKKAEEALRDSDRRKDEFVATLAHELRNPLAPIRNSLAILKLAHQDPSAVEQTTAVMERQLSHMVRLIDDLLDVSRISRGKLELKREQVELASVVYHALEICKPTAEAAKHEISVDLPSKPIYLNADPVRLTQLFSNLLSNACKFTKPGGHIHVSAQQVDQTVVWSVTDDGVGIPPDKLASIFEMFSQIDRTLEHTQTGLGLGLSLARILAELHGGTIEARSDGLGKGSQFIVSLPIVSQEPVPETHVKLDDKLVVSARYRILVVDDNRDNAESLAALLTMKGHLTEIAYDGAEAVEAATRYVPNVILLDIGLPKLNGYDACRRIREQPGGKDMILIALTGWGQDEDKRRSQNAGFDGHMTKPIELGKLMKSLTTLTRKKKPQRSPHLS